MTLQQILKSIGVPSQRLVFTGKEIPHTYATWQLVISVPLVAADDDVEEEVETYRVTLFSKDNVFEVLEQLKAELKKNDYVITSTDGEGYDNDTGYYQMPLTVQIVKENEGI